MTDETTKTFDQDQIDSAQKELDELAASLAKLVREGQGIPSATRVSIDPPVVNLRMLADGSIGHTNDIVLELNGVEARITSNDIEALVESGGDVKALIMARLGKIGAANPLNDAQLIRALLAKAGGEVEFTLDEVQAAKKPSTLQYDGLKLKLIGA